MVNKDKHEFWVQFCNFSVKASVDIQSILPAELFASRLTLSHDQKVTKNYWLKLKIDEQTI